jgi:hypothetical protein
MVKYRREKWFDIIGDKPCTGVFERLSPKLERVVSIRDVIAVHKSA